MTAPTTTHDAPAPEAPRDESRRWRSRPVLSRLLRALLTLVPVVSSIGVIVVVTHVVPTAVPQDPLLWRWAVLSGIATVVVVVVDRFVRRLLPLAALLQLSMVFPDQAPSRFGIALRTGTVTQLRKRYEEVRRDGPGETAAEAARTLVELVGALNAHDRLTRGHSERVRAYALMIGEELALEPDDLDRLRWAALLHDIGKLDVPADILNKPSRLTEDEWRLVRKHPESGARLVAPMREWLGDWSLAVLEHHERMDGLGYPAGLPGHRISLAARIVAVADVYDVMTSVRSYKTPLSSAAARAELTACAGTQFDPVVVRAFLNVSIGRLRLVMGPLSWIAQLPFLQAVPLGAVSQAAAVATAAASAAVSVLVGGAAAPPPRLPIAPVVAPLAPTHSSRLGAFDFRPPTTVGPVTEPTLGTSRAVDGATTTASTAPTATTTGTTTSTTTPGSPDGPSSTVPTDRPPRAEPTPDPHPTADPEPAPEPSDPPPSAPEANTDPTTTTRPVPAGTLAPPPPPAPSPPPTPPPPPGNQSPVAVDDDIGADVSGNTVHFDVRTNDHDPDGDALTVIGWSQPPGATVSRNSNGSLKLTFSAEGTFTFDYTVNDGHGGTAHATATVTVTQHGGPGPG